MKTIKVDSIYDIPKNFTGIAKDRNRVKAWYKNGKFHREDGPAIEYPGGTKEWYINDKLHRENGPAIEYNNGTKMWYINGKQHREDGPAIITSNGYKYWYLNDIRSTKEQHKIIMMFSEDSRQKLYKNNNLGIRNLLK